MNFTGADQEKGSYTQAGHALMAAARGIRVVSIEVLGDDGEGGIRLDQPDSDLDQAWIAYGGPQAEIVIYGK
jgi:hypothetical protein